MAFGQFLFFTREGSHFGAQTKGLLDRLNLPNQMLMIDEPATEERFKDVYTKALDRPPSFTVYGGYDVPQIFFEPQHPGGAPTQYVGGFHDLKRFILRNTGKTAE